MTVNGDDAVAMIDLQYVAIATLNAAKLDPAGAGGINRRTGRRRIVDAAMGADQIQDRMHAGEHEAGADAFEFERRAQEGFLHAATIGRVVTRDTIGANEPHRFVDAALVDEAGRQDVAILDEMTVLQDAFV